MIFQKHTYIFTYLKMFTPRTEHVFLPVLHMAKNLPQIRISPNFMSCKVKKVSMLQ